MMTTKKTIKTKIEDKDCNYLECANRHWTAKQRREYMRFARSLYLVVDKLRDVSLLNPTFWPIACELKELIATMPICIGKK